MNTTNSAEKGFTADPGEDKILILNTIPYRMHLLGNDDLITYAILGAEKNGTKFRIMLPMDES